MLHLELMYWWSTELHKSFLMSNTSPETYADTCIRHGLRFPFLMRQILATSALNMSLIKPEQRNFYHQHATQLQSEALAAFNSILESLNESNILPAFLASSLIGIHVFCDTFSFRDNNFNNTLDSLLSCIHLIRGVRSIIGGWWEYLISSELSPILIIAHENRQRMLDKHYPLDDLEKLIRNTDISTASREVYAEVIKELAPLFASQAELSEPDAAQSANMIFAWLVTVPKEYVDLLSARRPEALIILSYYAVILHQRRGFWAIGDAGRFLVDAIGVHLGQHWDQWLVWPRSMISK